MPTQRDQASLFAASSVLDLTPPVDDGGHGEVFTRRWIVDLILDLSGYTSDRDLATLVAVEPSCGSGAFLVPMVSRLAESLRRHNRELGDAADAIRAFDLLERNASEARAAVIEELVRNGFESSEASSTADSWVVVADYLLADHEPDSADFVLGNPPYVRLEDVADDRVAAYRATCSTMGGRADIFVGFFEVGLRCLRQGGTLGFICADRWQRNQYGAGLRRLIGERFSMVAAIEMHDVDAFDSQVSAYPAVTILRREPQGAAVIATTTRRFGESSATILRRWWSGPRTNPHDDGAFRVAQLPRWFTGDLSWPAGSPARLALLEDLNERFAPLEDRTTMTRIGIGIATGADGVFVTKDAELVEPERLLRLSMSRDTTSGHLAWSGHYLVNPWASDGSLISLSNYPRMAAYFQKHEASLRARHVSGRNPQAWYRTIDKADAALTDRPKLLFPDMKMTTHPVYDAGGLYPHHNLYFVISEGWDLQVLGGLLLSRVAELFVDSYAVKMRGGTLRFQAQYLRRIRVPRPESISGPTAHRLSCAFAERDEATATELALELYGIAGIPD